MSTEALFGRELGGYRIIGAIGAGGMGVVYRAVDLRLEREVALKVLRRDAASHVDILRFAEEARCASGLNHPNIVTIYGVGDDPEAAFIAMEMVHGHSLRETLNRRTLNLGEVFDIATPLADALAAAHRAGIIHRDLKPENVMITDEGLVKVLDFGLAKRPRREPSSEGSGDTRTALTFAGSIVGTPGYMSPEQASGQTAATTSDQFSFGVLLYEMVSGQRPFKRATVVETLAATIRDPAPPLEMVESSWAPLRQIIERCLAKDPQQRYSDTRDLLIELRNARQLTSNDSATSPRSVSPSSASNIVTQTVALPARPRVVTRRTLLWAAGAAAVAGGAALVPWRSLGGGTAIKQLAVLPFVNTARDDEAEYLCDGITERLIQQVSRLPSLTVMASSTVFNFKGNNTLDPRAIGRQLGVDAIVNGSVIQRGGRLRITAELVRVSNGAHLWGETYDRGGDEVLTVLDEIASAIANQGIRLALTTEEKRTLTQHPTDNPAAHEAYLRGTHALTTGSEEGVLQGRQFLIRAVTEDPRFALAYVALAGTYVSAAVDGYERPTEAFPQAARYTRQALEIDPQSAQAHSNAAEQAFFFDWDWPAAEREWRIAEEESTRGAALTEEQLGHSLSHWALGNTEESLRLARRVRQADPLTIQYAVREADYLYYAHQLDAAVAAYEKTIADQPTPSAYFGLAEVRRSQGRFDDAIEARRRGYELLQDDPLRDAAAAAMGKGAAGYDSIDRLAAEAELRSLKQRQGYVSPLDFARVLAILGRADETFSYLDAAFAERSPGLVFLNVDRAWDAVRADSRFVAAVTRVGLPRTATS